MNQTSYSVVSLLVYRFKIRNKIYNFRHQVPERTKWRMPQSTKIASPSTQWRREMSCPLTRLANLALVPIVPKGWVNFFLSLNFIPEFFIRFFLTLIHRNFIKPRWLEFESRSWWTNASSQNIHLASNTPTIRARLLQLNRPCKKKAFITTNLCLLNQSAETINAEQAQETDFHCPYVEYLYIFILNALNKCNLKNVPILPYFWCILET